MSDEPLEMALCEQEFLILRPDQLYVFRVMPGCPKCERLRPTAAGPHMGESTNHVPDCE